MIYLYNAIPSSLNIINEEIWYGDNECYNALQTITVAGNSTTFIIFNGGSATMIAGQSVLLLPGVFVHSGGYLHTYITTNGNYCGTAIPLQSRNEIDEGEDMMRSSFMDEYSFFKVYPNPTSGKFIIEINPDGIQGKIFWHIYRLFGEMIFQGEMPHDGKKEVSLENQPDGLYIISLISDNQTGTAKIIKY